MPIQNLSISRLSDPFVRLYWVISEFRSPDYTVKSANFKMWMFLANFLHEITLYAIGRNEKRFITSSFTLENHFENRTFIAPTSPQHLQVRNITLSREWIEVFFSMSVKTLLNHQDWLRYIIFLLINHTSPKSATNWPFLPQIKGWSQW